ncbi:MAG: CDP-alcohol phosphatidyltransferase family protein [Acutalibacteraceae bacterium]
MGSPIEGLPISPNRNRFLKEMMEIANLITACRILFSILILFCPALSPMFYALYLSAGLTDIFDGFIARKTNTVSEFGSELDTVADFILLVVCMVKLFPVISIPVWLWAWIGIIAAIKIVNIISGYAVHKKFVVKHTIANKATGLMLFILPLTLSSIEIAYSGGVICAVATFAAIQEGHFIRTG